MVGRKRNQAERGGAEQNSWQSRREKAVLHPLCQAVHAGVCSVIPVTPAADPGRQHDLSLPSGHPASLACKPIPPLSRPRVHSPVGGGRRCCPAKVPASLPREQPQTLGEYMTVWLCLSASRYLLIFFFLFK